MGVTAQAVQQWEKDKTIPDPERLSRVAIVLDVTIQYLVTGHDLQEQSGNDIIQPVAHLRGRVVPRYSMDKAYRLTLDETSANYVHSHFPCSEQAYCLMIQDAANAPDFQPGDSVIVDPLVHPMPGDMVYAAMGIERRPVFRRFKVLSLSPPKYQLEPINALWGAELIAAPEDGAIIAVMTEHTRPRRSQHRQ